MSSQDNTFIHILLRLSYSNLANCNMQQNQNPEAQEVSNPEYYACKSYKDQKICLQNSVFLSKEDFA